MKFNTFRRNFVKLRRTPHVKTAHFRRKFVKNYENLRTQTRCLEKNEEKHERERKFRMKKEANREATIGFPEDYAEELSPLLLPGRRSETGAGWLGDAGEYCGDTGEDCDAGVLNCEYGGETVENCEAGV